jgi:hypothetical protein
MWKVGLVHIVDTCRMWSGSGQSFDFVEGMLAAGCHDLYPTVGEIADPASDRQMLGLTRQPPPESDPLHSSRDE